MSDTPHDDAHPATRAVGGRADPGEEADPRAFIAGAVAALIGGGLWAAFVIVTKYELGWVAWGVGGLVGVVMSRVTPVRGRTVALFGAGAAAIGLLAGKALIAAYTVNPGTLAHEITADSSLMLQAASWHLETQVGWPEGIQAQLEAVGDGDTLSDALWAEMLAASAAHAGSWTPHESSSVAMAFARAVLGEVGALDRLRLQFGPWDLLWFGLAVVTAFRILRGTAAEPAAEASDA